MTKELHVKMLEIEIQKSLKSFIGQKIGSDTFAQAKSSILNILHKYLNTGEISEIPIVDINHQSELSHLMRERDELNQKQYSGTYEEQIEIRNSMARINMKMNYLKDQIRNLNGMEIFFKNKDFSPYLWRP